MSEVLETSLRTMLEQADIKVPYQLIYEQHAKQTRTPLEELTSEQKRIAFIQYGIRKLEEHAQRVQDDDVKFPTTHSVPIDSWFKRCVQQFPEQQDYIDGDGLLDRKRWGDAVVDWKAKWFKQFYELLDPVEEA